MKAITTYFLLIILLNLDHVKVFAQERDPIMQAIEANKKREDYILLTGTPQEKYDIASRKAKNFAYQKEYAKAIEMYTIAIQQKPEMPALYFSRANAKYEIKDYRGSIDDCTRGLSLTSGHEYSYYKTILLKTRAEAKDELKDYTGAIEDYNKLIESNPRYHIAYIGRGISKYNSRQFNEAISDFDTAIKLSPNASQPHLLKGQALIKMEQKENGCREFSRAGELGDSKAYEYIRKHCQ